MLKRISRLLVVISFVLSFFCVFGSLNRADAAPSVIQYHVTDTYLGNGFAEVRGYFTNSGNTPVALKNFRIGVSFINKANGRVIYSAVKVFNMGRLYIDRGKVWQKLVFKHPNIRPNTNAKFSSYNYYFWWDWCNRR